MGFLLAPIALFLFALVGSIHSIVTLLIAIPRRAFLKTTSKLKFQLAFDIDVFGNYLFRDTWNVIFAWKTKIFGVFGETISSALGRGRRDGGLSWVGWLFSWFLDIIWITDWIEWKLLFSSGKLVWKKGHCRVSIMSEERIEEIRKQYYGNN